VRDGVLVRLVGKWLNAGVLEEGVVKYPEQGSPQGGVISPMLANIYLHEVLDTWFEQEVKPRLKGRAFLIRFADDAVLCFSREDDARRAHEVLPKRFGRYGLTLHPEKTRLVRFERPKDDGPAAGTFDLLGFTHYWGQGRQGSWVVKRKTGKGRLSRALQRIGEWSRGHRHDPLRAQHQMLTKKLKGHDAYYGITGNYPALVNFRRGVERTWRKWLGRRSQRAIVTWDHFKRILAAFPLPCPKVVRSVYRAANP
jgi:hypothetical protein